MRCAVLAAPLALATFGAVARAEAGAASWLVIEGACSATPSELARQVDQQLIGARPAAVSARVTIATSSAGYRVTLHATRARRSLGVKQLVAPSCGEALDAAVLVLAIALTEPEPVRSAPQEEIGHAPARAMTSNESPLPFTFAAPRTTPERDVPARAEDEDATGPGRRLGMLFGIETGTLPRPTAYVGASFALPVGAWEMRSGLRYGLPTEEESVETSSSERERRDFAALGLSLCRGVGVAWRLSLCGGGEFGVVRVDRTRRDGGVEFDSNEDQVRVAGVATTRLTGRTGPIRPELEFSAAAASLGPGAPATLSLRLAAGVAMQF